MRLAWALVFCSLTFGQQPRGYTIPTLDIAGETHRQVVVDREAGQYLGHPSTLLLPDERTVLVAYPKGHGKGGVVKFRNIRARSLKTAAAKAAAVSPPATEKASGKLEAPNTATGPTGRCIIRRSGRGNGDRSGIAWSWRISCGKVSSICGV